MPKTALMIGYMLETKRTNKVFGEGAEAPASRFVRRKKNLTDSYCIWNGLAGRLHVKG